MAPRKLSLKGLSFMSRAVFECLDKNYAKQKHPFFFMLNTMVTLYENDSSQGPHDKCSTESKLNQ